MHIYDVMRCSFLGYCHAMKTFEYLNNVNILLNFNMA